MRLFHFSEDPHITRFEPHRAPSSALDDEYVWAIDERHAPMYYFPRDCPRACFWAGPATSDDDRERWMGGSGAAMVIAIEAAWLERMRETTLYRYAMPPETFTQVDETAGHWVSRTGVSPLGIDTIDDLLGAIVAAGAELRVMPALFELWGRVIASTLEFSGTRLRNARGYADFMREYERSR
jgi:hypothetical protein